MTNSGFGVRSSGFGVRSAKFGVRSAKFGVRSSECEVRSGHPIYLLETFVDPSRFRGTCYRAANWMVVGQTTGRGKDDQTKRPNRPIKQILVLPLVRDFRRLMAC